MERIVWKRQSVQPFYVFDRRHVVNFWDDDISVSAAADWYQDPEAKLSALQPPHIYLKALTLEQYRALVLGDRLPISITLSGPNVGSTKLTSGYSELDLGAFQRRVLNQQTRLFYAGDALVLGFAVETSPVDPASARAEISDEDKAPKRFAYEFRVPLDSVPEVLNFTERERQAFLRLRASNTSVLASAG